MKSASNGSLEDANSNVTWSSSLVLALGVPQVLVNLISIICNAVVVFGIATVEQRRRPIIVLFRSLALSDLLTGCSSLYVALLFISNPDNSIHGSQELLVAYSIFTVSILSTVYNLISIGVERYLTVADCLRERGRLSEQHIWLAAGSSWILASLLGMLPLMGWNCLGKEAAASRLYGPFCIDYLIFIAAPNFAVASLCLLLTYVAIIVILRRQSSTVAAHAHSTSCYKVAEARVTKTSAFIWVTTLISYAPFFGGVLWDVLDHSPAEDIRIGVYIFRNCTAIMITANSLVNPIIYTHKQRGLGCSMSSLKGCLQRKTRERTVANP
ncbi:G-protein coupled receptor 6-like [Callorhinchus milii]|uniref:G-protein coupled receptor 6-like n=1 Tax=Callorhinchus milii TaxID=7868 RepID=UPI0004576161|nr:G-protein coupled receptor 6-like [Callorhinchus milii]|eukprot:gi/632958166/ref/XP_007894879.1/ PREDICTED: G-protein coupled receptor 6-like [Callorhinchus milii]